MKILPLVINLWGGPGVGKSSTAYGLTSALKWNGVNAELVTEFAKDKVWEGSAHVLEDQIYVFAKQQRRMRNLRGKVDVIVTDSPLPLSLIYDKDPSDHFYGLVMETFESYWNFNVELLRNKPYEMAGRVQTEVEAKEIDRRIHRFILRIIPHVRLLAQQSNIERLVSYVTDLLAPIKLTK